MSSPRVTKLITFDGRGTVFNMIRSVGALCGQAAAVYGAKLPSNYEDALNSAFKSEWKRLTVAHPCFGANSGLTSQEWWQQMVRGVLRGGNLCEENISDAKIKLVSAHLFKQLSTRSGWIVKDDAHAALTELKSARPEIKLGVISNTDERLDSILLQLGLRHFFEFTINSYAVKVEKPQKAIFDLALEKAQLDNPEEAIHVGDDLELDYLGARNAGWRALLITRSAEQFLEKMPPKDVITSLSQVKDKLF